MKILIDTFLRTLKERNELDALLPDLLVEMGMSLISRPQQGTRQHGVDLAAAGVDDGDGIRKLFLFVIKQGDIGRQEWAVGVNAVRPTLDEVVDSYIPGFISAEHKLLPIKIVVCTSGERKEQIGSDWAGYTSRNAAIAEIVFWGSSYLAGLVERHLLSENLFNAEDRRDLRKLLSLIAETDYKYRDLHRLVVRQLGIKIDGSAVTDVKPSKEIAKSLVRVNLIARMAIGWDENDRNTKNGVIAAEHVLLWAYRRVSLEAPAKRRHLAAPLLSIWQTYSAAAIAYLDRIERHASVRNGLGGYNSESSLFSVTVFELIGLVSSIGLAHIYQSEGDEKFAIAYRASGILENVLNNNPIVGSPPFDRNVVEICLALTLLIITGQKELASDWLRSLIVRFRHSHILGRRFPISSDSIEDLAQFTFEYEDATKVRKFKGACWALATLYGWCAVLNDEESYKILLSGADVYEGLTPQLWHPMADTNEHIYVSAAYFHSGISDAPMDFPADLSGHRSNMDKLLAKPELNVFEGSFAFENGYFGVDFVACRHHRTPIAPAFWYRLRDLWPLRPAGIEEAEPGAPAPA
jgi:hypothetical protein